MRSCIEPADRVRTQRAYTPAGKYAGEYAKIDLSPTWQTPCLNDIRQAYKQRNMKRYYTGKDAHSDKRLISNLRHWDWTARNLGFKPHMSKFGAEHTKSLLARKVIALPKNAEGVRCRLELTNGTFSRESLRLVVGLLKSAY